MGFFILFFLGIFLLFAGMMFGFSSFMMIISLVLVVVGLFGSKLVKSLRTGYTTKIKNNTMDNSKDMMDQAAFMARVNEIFYYYNLDQKAISMSGYAMNNLAEQDFQKFSGYVSANQKAIKKNEKCYQFGYLIFGEQNVFLYQFFIDNKITNNVSEKYDWINYHELVNVIDVQGGFAINTMVGKNFELYIENAEQAAYIKQYLYYKMQMSRG